MGIFSLVGSDFCRYIQAENTPKEQAGLLPFAQLILPGAFF